MPLTPAMVTEFSCWNRLIDSGTTEYLMCATVLAGKVAPEGVRM